jgi:hypothetical protein
MVPTDATVCTDVAYLEAVGVLKGWQFRGHLSWGGLTIVSGCVHVKCLVRPLMIKLFTEAIELLLLGAKIGSGRSGGVGFQGAVHTLVAAIVLRFARFDDLRQDAQADPPSG